MRLKVDRFVDLFDNFDDLPEVEQIAKLVYFSTELERRQTVSRQELEHLFTLAGLPRPRSLQRLLTYLCREGRRLVAHNGEYQLRHAVRKRLEAELQAARSASVPEKPIGANPFAFPGRTFKDKKVGRLLGELGACYRSKCWNACGILMRIIIERTLDSVGSTVRAKDGLKAKLNYCARASDVLSKSVRDSLQQLHGIKIAGDIVAHHSKILLDKPDVDLAIAHFRLLLKEVSTI